MSMGIFQDNWHRHFKTGGKRKPYHKNQKYELGCHAANTKIGPLHKYTVHVWGGNKHNKRHCCHMHKTRIVDAVYDASNNELVHTMALVKNWIVLTDSPRSPQCRSPTLYCLPPREILNKKTIKENSEYDERKKNAKISSLLEERQGQCGRADGYVLEGKELEFHQWKIKVQQGK
ncbi:unnamed protein product [Nyctereutes procyonoides]|uniref:(raccoon dog) hypothetical protein n=1 Tax=Nyctereutes procyonoides TaxID=34880 RepID=A0A811YGH4_NYCPR|nr:unnamed protein product [Nyctereutes procyonoides]